MSAPVKPWRIWPAEQVALAKDRKLAAAVATIYQQHKELANAQAQNDDLRRQLAAGTLRVRIPAHCSSLSMPTSTSIIDADNGATTAELAPAFIESLVGIIGDNTTGS